MCTHVCMCTCVCVCERERVCMCAYMYDCMCMVCVYVDMRACAHSCVCKCTCMCVYVRKMQAQACLTLKASSQCRPVVLEEGDGELTGGHGQRHQGGQTPHDAAHTVCYPAAQGVVANIQHPQQLYATAPTNSHW